MGVKISIIILLLLFIPLVSSQVIENPTTIKQGEPFNISHPVRTGGSPSAAIYCNISYYDSDGFKIVDWQPMTNGFDEHYYELNTTQTLKLGCGTYDVTCTDGTNNATESFELCITTTGESSGTSSILSLWIWGIAIFLLTISVIFNIEQIGIISGVLFLIGGLYGIRFGIGNVSDIYTRSIAIIGLAFGSIIIFTAGSYLYKNN